MKRQPPDTGRRKLLLASTMTLGGIGVGLAAVPFVASMLPSERAKARGGPVEVDLGKVAPAALWTVEWRGKPVWVLHRTEAMLERLGRHDELLADPSSERPQQPDYARNPQRSIKPESFVAIGICTHLGCVPRYRPQPASADLGPEWPGGFFCPCHGSAFDLAGRVFKNVPAPTNLEIPPHRYVSETRIVIGKERA